MPPASATRRAVVVCSSAVQPKAAGGSGLREADRLDAGAARVSPAGDRRGPDEPDVVLRRGPPRRIVRARASSWRRAPCWSARSSCSASSATRPASRRAARIASAISSWRRGCRSSCGAASRTTSCSTWPAAGSLSKPAVLDAQVRRMLADPRAQALVDNFAGQWLHIRNLRSTTPDKNDFPDFDDNLRQAFERELELFVGSIIAEDRSVLDLMTADYTFVNERLAKHYGIPNVYGQHFRRVSLTRGCPPRAAGQGRRPAADVARRSHVAGGARQVDSRQPARHAAAAAACRRAAVPRRGAGRADAPCGRGWSSTGRTRRARAATR